MIAGIAQTLDQGDGVGAVDISGTGATSHEVVAAAAVEGDILHIIKRQGGIVLEQHTALGGTLACDLGVSGKVGLVVVLIPLKTLGLDDELKDAAYAGVKVFLCQLAALHGSDDVGTVLVQTRLQEVVASVDVGSAVRLATTANGIHATKPVGHDETLEAPVVAEHGGQQIIALTGHRAVDEIIG